jgi:hypothetical protein
MGSILQRGQAYAYTAKDEGDWGVRRGRGVTRGTVARSNASGTGPEFGGICLALAACTGIWTRTVLFILPQCHSRRPTLPTRQ